MNELLENFLKNSTDHNIFSAYKETTNRFFKQISRQFAFYHDKENNIPSY